jgi:uncharacterized protein YdeI (YjbR/CyaY-like superfamily)
MKKQPGARDEFQIFASAAAWERWLAANHARSAGVTLLIAKKRTGVSTVTHPEALDVALCYGWIDAIRRAHDETHFAQRFTPRRPKSLWSKINREKVAALIAAGRMKAAGLAEIERAKADGRWEAAYDGQKGAEVPLDLQAELDASPKAKKFFLTLKSQNRFAIIFRLQTARTPETRARRLATFVAMLKRGETIYPQ